MTTTAYNKVDMDILQSLQRDINVIMDSSSERNVKRRSLEKILKETVGGPKVTNQDLAALLFGELIKPLLKCLSDPVEKCREIAIKIIAGFTHAVEDIIPFLPYTIPAYSSRLGELEIVEPSEEIRLQLLISLISMVDKAGPAFAPGVDEAVKILGRTLLDPYPEVKKESCKLAICIAKHAPKATGLHSSTLCKAILPCLLHRHSAVRIMGLKAIQDVILADASGLEEATVVDTLRGLTRDKTPAVREILYEVSYVWLSQVPDRYPLGYKILPTLYSGVTDEVVKLRTLAEKYMEELGVLYEKEWEKRVKDEMDVTVGVGNVNLLQGRPRVGCRHLARDNTQKITRLKSALVLSAFIPYTEENITGYIGNILPVLYKTLSSDEPSIMAATQNVSEIVGRYVDPDLYINLLLNHIRSNSDALSFKLGCLKTLKSLLKGTPAERLQYRNFGDVAELASVLVAKLAEVIGGEVEGVKGDLEVVGYRLFVVLVTLSSPECGDNVKGWPEIKALVSDAFNALRNAYRVSTDSGLFSIHFSKLLASLKERSGSWTRFSPDLRVMNTLFLSSGHLVGEHLSDIVLMLGSLCEESRDIELRVSVLKTLERLLAATPTPLNSTGSLLAHVPDLLKKVIWTSAVWRPGRKLVLVRKAAMENLHALLKFMTSIPVTDASAAFARHSIAPFLKEANEFVPCIVGCLDEDDAKTRELTLMSFGLLFSYCVVTSVTLEAAFLKKVYPELLKRLDDSVDDIRIRACGILEAFAEIVHRFHLQHKDLADGAHGFTRLDDVHWVALIKGIVIHVDDSNGSVSGGIECLYKISKVAPVAVVKEQLEAVKSRYRNVEALERVLKEVVSPL
ncbi:armadillo-type protein [Chytridium lagenaria]|nr:armadillo-type protein [Chytridium lagenaria]